ncbi:hypothetical protein KJA16_00600 [Patescibacteria group bacterium]|nr:hypothetical protein [Patescibacteria group bacterium]
MSKIIIIIIIAIVFVGLVYWYLQVKSEPKALTEKEKACINSGGKISTSLCCNTTGDFPNTCLIGPCGCSPEYSHEVKVCDCGPDKCFDGSECLSLDEVSNLLEDLKQETGIDFSEIKPVEFRWIAKVTPTVQDVNIKGKRTEAIGISIEQEAKVEEFLKNKGFKKDLYNVAAGTISELVGYKKEQIVCAVVKGATGHREATGQWIPPEPEKRDVDVNCGKLEIPLGVDPLNSTYIIDEELITLEDGYSEQEIVPGAATKIKMRIFGEPTIGDVNGDGVDDAVVLLTYDPGGSGTFYYIAVALKIDGGYKGTNAVLLGDRIAPKDTHIENGLILHNYADRMPWEPFSVQSSVGKTKYLRIENEKLKEISREPLFQDTATALIKENWGDCTLVDCERLTVNVLDGKDGVWYVQAIYEGMRDDSVQATKKIARAHHVNNAWELGEVVLIEYKCQLGRGHQDFSSELCL